MKHSALTCQRTIDYTTTTTIIIIPINMFTIILHRTKYHASSHTCYHSYIFTSQIVTSLFVKICQRFDLSVLQTYLNHTRMILLHLCHSVKHNSKTAPRTPTRMPRQLQHGPPFYKHILIVLLHLLHTIT